MLQKMRIEEESNDSCNCITLCGEIIDCPKEDQKSHLSISTASGHEKGIHVLTIKTKSRVELCGVVYTLHRWVGRRISNQWKFSEHQESTTMTKLAM